MKSSILNNVKMTSPIDGRIVKRLYLVNDWSNLWSNFLTLNHLSTEEFYKAVFLNSAIKNQMHDLLSLHFSEDDVNTVLKASPAYLHAVPKSHIFQDVPLDPSVVFPVKNLIDSISSYQNHSKIYLRGLKFNPDPSIDDNLKIDLYDHILKFTDSVVKTLTEVVDFSVSPDEVLETKLANFTDKDKRSIVGDLGYLDKVYILDKKDVPIIASVKSVQGGRNKSIKTFTTSYNPKNNLPITSEPTPIPVSDIKYIERY